MNHCLNRLDERRRRSERLEPHDPDLLPGRSRADLETTESLERALATLPDEQRTVLVLRAIDGLTYREIAESLSIPIGTVMSRLARARERLLGTPEGSAARVGAPDAEAPPSAVRMESAHDERA